MPTATPTRQCAFASPQNGAVGAGNAIATVSFNSEFRDENVPFQPVVLVSGDLPFYAVSVTSLSFVLKSTQGLGQRPDPDFFAATFRPNGC